MLGIYIYYSMVSLVMARRPMYRDSPPSSDVMMGVTHIAEVDMIILAH